MGLFDNLELPTASLFGSQENPNYASILGDAYDPQELKKRKLHSTLRNMGIALLSQKPNDNVGGGFMTPIANALGQGVASQDQAEADYLKEATTKYAKDMHQKLIDGAPSNLKEAVRQDPDGYSKYLFAQSLQKAKQDWDEQHPKLTGNGAEFGLQPQWIKNKKTGKIRYVQVAKDGTQPILGPDEEYAPSLSFQNLGLEVGGFNPKTGAQESSAPIAVAGREAAEARGKGSGEAQLNLPKAKANIDMALEEADAIYNPDTGYEHPGMEWGTGSIVGEVPDWATGALGDDVKEFRIRARQLKNGAFLQAYETLRGGGQISETEGEKASEAINRASVAQSKEAYKRAMNDYRKALKRGFAAIVKQASMTDDGSGRAAPTTVEGDGGWVVMPNGNKVRQKVQ